MSANPPLPYETCPRNDYSAWYEMINSIVSFVTASTHLASTLKSSNYYLPKDQEITETGEDNSAEKPEKSLEASVVACHSTENSPKDNKYLSFHEIYKVEPLIEFQSVDRPFAEPNNEPRCCKLVNLDNIGDNLPSESDKNEDIVKKEASNDSCFINDFSDSDQTIESSNLQENFENQEEICVKQVVNPKKITNDGQTCTVFYEKDSWNERKAKDSKKITQPVKCKKLVCETPKKEYNSLKNVPKIVCKKYECETPLSSGEKVTTPCKKKIPVFQSRNKDCIVKRNEGDIDAIRKNIVNTVLNVGKTIQLNQTKTEKNAKQMISASTENSIKKAEERLRSALAGKTTRSANQIKPDTYVKLAKSRQQDIPEKPNTVGLYNATTRSEMKSCLKQANPKCTRLSDSKSVKMTIQPKALLPNMQGTFSNKVPIVCDTTLKMTAAETLKQADKLLQNAKVGILKPQTAKKVPSRTMRPIGYVRK